MTRQITIVLTVDDDDPRNNYNPAQVYPNFVAAAEAGDVETGQGVHLEFESGDVVRGTLTALGVT